MSKEIKEGEKVYALGPYGGKKHGVYVGQSSTGKCCIVCGDGEMYQFNYSDIHRAENNN